MRLSGSPDGCDAAARQLQRAALDVARTAEELQRAEVAEWAGAAAQGWERLASERVRRLRGTAEAVGAVGRAVAQHADALRELHSRAGRLTAQAADVGLHLDDDGWIAPVPLPEAAAPEAVREVLHRQQVRRRVMAGAEQVRVEEGRAHERLLRELSRARRGPVSGQGCDGSADDRLLHRWRSTAQDEVDWQPNGWDLPSAAVSLGQVAGSVTDRVPAVLRSAMGSTVLGAATGGIVDMTVHDFDLGDAVTKNGVITGGAVVVGAAGAAVSAPVWVTALAAGGTAYGVGRLFDAHGHRLPWVQHESERGADRKKRAPRAAPVNRHPRPTPGPAPRRP